ncbi:MAG TPA: PD-(D/E)XK nuclease family protein [Ktedonobacterales bacterium]|jgi:CRISPR-associated exonuclease Cas4
MMAEQTILSPQRSLASAPAAAGNEIGVTLICLAAVVLLALLVLLFNEFRARRWAPRPARQEKKAAQRLPEGKIVYQDADGTGEPLLATGYPLSGKPDYVILAPDGSPIPVELKLSSDSEEPQRHHVMQLATYFVILEDLYAQPPAYGVLRYANKDFTIQYTDALKRKVLRRLAELERCDEQHPPALAHQDPGKCQTCPFQPICPIGLRQEN